MRTFCEEKAQERQMLPWQQWMEYSFPCELEPCCSPPGCGSVKSRNTKKIFINIKFEACDVSRSAVFMSHICKGFSDKSNQMLWYDGAARIKHNNSGKNCAKQIVEDDFKSVGAPYEIPLPHH